MRKYINSAAFDLGWYVHAHNSTLWDHDDAKISAWIEHLVPSLSHVILTERFDEGLVLLRRKLRLPLLEMAYVPLNVELKTAGLRPSPNATERQRFLRVNHVSDRLYTHFSQTFEAEWSAAADRAHLVLEEELRDLRVGCLTLLTARSKPKVQSKQGGVAGEEEETGL